MHPSVWTENSELGEVKRNPWAYLPCPEVTSCRGQSCYCLILRNTVSDVRGPLSDCPVFLNLHRMWPLAKDMTVNTWIICRIKFIIIHYHPGNIIRIAKLWRKERKVYKEDNQWIKGENFRLLKTEQVCVRYDNSEEVAREPGSEWQGRRSLNKGQGSGKAKVKGRPEAKLAEGPVRTFTCCGENVVDESTLETSDHILIHSFRTQ